MVSNAVMVSVETVKLVNELARAVTVKDWMEEVVEAKE
jgi:hypothetical protein